MLRNKEDFYGALWEDYMSFDEKEREKSFIYGYFKKKKDYRAELLGQDKAALDEYSCQKKRDKYIMLKSAYTALTENGVITEEEYTDYLKDVIGKVSGGKLTVPAKYEKLNGREEIDNAEKMFERRFLMGCVGDFFYNLGYRMNKNTEHSQSVKLENKHLKEDGYNDDFDMLYHFTQYKGGEDEEVRAVSYGALDEAYIGKCVKLYKAMIRDGRTNSLVPLYIDSRTGAGIYIIGSDRFHDETNGYKYLNENDICMVCVANFMMADIMDKYMGSDYVPMWMAVEKSFRSVKKAFEYFRAFVSENEAYKNYPDENDEELPEKIDEEFNLFFISKKENAARMKAEVENSYTDRLREKLEANRRAERAAEVDRIFRDMLAFPVQKLRFRYYKREEDFLDEAGASALKDREYISFGDVLFLLYYLPDSDLYQHLGRGEREELRNELLAELFMAMNDSLTVSAAVHDFMMLTVDEYLAHISQMGPYRERPEEMLKADIEYYREKTLACSEYSLNERTTLFALQRQMEHLVYPNGKTEEELKKLVHICNEDVYYLLIKYVRKKYYDMFDYTRQLRFR